MQFLPLAAVAAAALAALKASGQSVTLTPESVIPSNEITWDYQNTDYTTLFGLIDFRTTSNTNVYTFCIDLSQDVVTGTPYTFNYTPVANAPVSMVNNVILPTMGSAKAMELSQLYGLVFASSNPEAYNPLSLTATELQAFQVAVSNIVFDTDASVSRGAGTFYLPNTDSTSLAIVAQANAWLGEVANEGSGGLQMPLIALTNINYQDQITPIPEPIGGSLFAGIVALASAVGMQGARIWRTRVRCL
jgi:hypothetical protein